MASLNLARIDKIPLPPIDFISHPNLGNSILRSRTLSLSPRSDRVTTPRKREREPIVAGSNSGTSFSFPKNGYDDLADSSDEKIEAMERQVWELRAEQAVKRRRIHKPELEARIVKLKSKREHGQAERLGTLNDMSAAAKELSDKMEGLSEMMQRLQQDHERATIKEMAELEALERQLSNINRGESTDYATMMTPLKRGLDTMIPSTPGAASTMEHPRPSFHLRGQHGTRTSPATSASTTASFIPHTLAAGFPQVSGGRELPEIPNILTQRLPWQRSTPRRRLSDSIISTSTTASGVQKISRPAASTAS
jgi:hypothetical protein